MLVKVGEVLKLLNHLAEHKVGLVMLLDLAALVHVDAEAFAEQLKDLLGNLLAGLQEGMDQLLNVSDIQP